MQAKIIEILLMIALFAGGYFFIQYQGKKIDELTSKLEATNIAMKDYGEHVKSETESRTKYLNDLKEFSKNETANRIAVAGGSKQLRVVATCPKVAPVGDGPGTKEAGPVLTANAGQDYFSARDNIFRNENLLVKCESDLQNALDKINGEGKYKLSDKGFFK